jgi:hypothetical protein
MSDDLWYMQFDVTKWQRDVDEHPLDIRGAWITICCKLWWASKRGELTLRPERWAVILRTDITNTNRIIDYLLKEEIASGKREANGYVTLISRKILKDNKAREMHRLRQQKHYYKKKADANLTHTDGEADAHSDAYIKSKSKNKSNKEIKDRGKRTAPFVPPSVNDVFIYCQERKNSIDVHAFIDHYTSNGWMVGKNKMKDWKAAVRTWEKRNFTPVKNTTKDVKITLPKPYEPEAMPEMTEEQRRGNLERVGKLLDKIGGTIK